jgi:hypothetical protein
MPKPTLVSLITLEHLQKLDFWSRVARTDDPTECWEWTAGKAKRSERGGEYGTVHISPRITGLPAFVSTYAHRVAYALGTGILPGPGQVIDHRCYNTVCCNPAHLDLTTQLVNVRRCRKPMCRATPFTRPDGSTRWQVRWYDYSGPKRRYLAKSFDNKADADAFAKANRAA